MALAVDAVSVPHLLGVAAHCRLHVVGRVAGPHRVVLMGHRRAEEGHDAFPQDLVHRTLVAMYGVHHALNDRVENLPGLLGVAIR